MSLQDGLVSFWSQNLEFKRMKHAVHVSTPCTMLSRVCGSRNLSLLQTLRNKYRLWKVSRLGLHLSEGGKILIMTNNACKSAIFLLVLILIWGFFFQIFNSKKNVFHGDDTGGVNRVIGTVRHLANKLQCIPVCHWLV